MVQTVVLLAGVISSVLIGWFVVTRDPSRRLNQLYGFLTLSFIALTVFNYFTLESSESLLYFIRLVTVSTTVASAALLFLVLDIFTSAIKKQVPRWLNVLLVVSTVVVVALELSGAVFASLSNGPSPTPVPGWGIAAFIFHFVAFVGATTAILFAGVKKAPQKEGRQFKTMFYGMLPILFLAPITSVILPVFFKITAFIPYTPLYLVFFLGMIGYAIVKHGLFDIKLAAVRTLAYALTLISLAGIYGLLALGISQEILGYQSTLGESAVNIGLALVLAFIFQPIKRFFDRVTDRIFYKDKYGTNEFVSKLSEVLTSTIDLRTLLQRAAIEIGSTLKSEQAYFFVEYAESKHVSAGTKDHTSLTPTEFENLQKILDDDIDIVVADLYPAEHELSKLLRSKSIAILMPLRHKSLLLGFLALGDQLSSGYTQRDVRVLEMVKDELLIAIQNALSLQEVRDLNATLQQKIDAATKELRHSNVQLKKLDATKDEFISMASHQLRTPLTAVKGYISMVLDGDIGEISPEQRQVLEQAFESSQRMVFLIGDFLNVSRIQTGKFMLELSDVDLTKLIPEEIDQLVDTARSRQIELKYDGPSTLPAIQADENKLRQVMMNFMDNAIFYSRANSTITVRLYRDADAIVFKVVDTGIGVPRSEQAHLFTKFYRASNARQQRPDGTGIGLYMAKKVIVSHGGSIIFETKEDVGSTFGFRLPLKNKLHELSK